MGNRFYRLSAGGSCMLIEVEGVMMGYTRAMLLEEIGKSGSLALAADAVSIPYDHAKDLVTGMNSHSGDCLVELGTTGNARLTGEGKLLVSSFWKLYAELKATLCEGIVAGTGERACDYK